MSLFNGWYTNMPTNTQTNDAWNEAERRRREAEQASAGQRNTGINAGTSGQPNRTTDTGTGYTMQNSANPFVPQLPSGAPPQVQAQSPSVTPGPGAGSGTRNPGQGTGATAPYTPGAGSPQASLSDAEFTQNSRLYNVDSPQAALRNAMAAKGMNVFSMNPVIQTMMSMAPALASTFLMRGANGQIGSGITDGNLVAQGGMGKFFGEFLKNGLTGAGGLSSIISNPLNNGGPLAALRQAQQDIANQGRAASQPGYDATNANPFTLYLRNMIANDPSNGAGMISSFMTPGMNANMGRAYGQGLETIGSMAPGNVPTSFFQNPDRDLFGYMLNMYDQ